MAKNRDSTKLRERSLDTTGKIIASRMKFATLSGRDAVILYLVNKHHWTLDATRKLSDTELVFLTDHVDGESEASAALASR